MRALTMPEVAEEVGAARSMLGVQATNGVTLVDGEVVDPDRGKPGMDICPAGDLVTFDLPR